MKRQLTTLSLIFSLAHFPSQALAKKESLDIKELALPSEVQDLGKSGGSVYYSPVVKDKVLIPVHIWGAVQRPGLHFVPMGTNLVEGLSLAGGPTTQANLRRVKVTRGQSGDFQGEYYNLATGGQGDSFSLELSPKDTVFIERSTFSEDRAYYTSLVGVIATVLTSVLLYREIKKN